MHLAGKRPSHAHQPVTLIKMGTCLRRRKSIGRGIVRCFGCHKSIGRPIIRCFR
jgi:hypothetical protein